MTGDAPATLVWLAPDPPNPAQTDSLAAWASAHGIRLTPPSATKLAPIAINEDDAEEVERHLERAHDAIAAHDAETADRVLSAAETLLKAHPELPQGAWLMAEVLRARSTRLRRIAPTDEDAAERAWQRADALDGGRVAGIGEQASVAHAVEIPPAGSTVHWALPAPPPCSADDVKGAHAVAGGIDASLVRCVDWVAAQPGHRPGSIEVALCETGRCGPLLEWTAPERWTWTPPPPEPRASGWPTWATWGLVGAGAAIATGVSLFAAGVFQSAPTEVHFVNGGIKTR